MHRLIMTAALVLSGVTMAPINAAGAQENRSMSTKIGGVEALREAESRNLAFFSDYLRLFSAMEFDAWAERFWHPQGRFLVAYPAGGGSNIAGDGRTQILANMKGLANVVTRLRADDLRLHQTLDPDVFIVQYRMHAEYRGGTYDNDLMSIVRLSEGKVIELTEYYNIASYEAFLRGIGALK